MRRRFTLQPGSLEAIKVLIHGGPGVGKTRLQGDAMAATLARGGTAAFIDIGAQNGYRVLTTMGLDAAHVETIDTFDSFIEAMDEFASNPFDVLCLDSIRDLQTLSLVKVTGGDRPPKTGTKDNEYTPIYFNFEMALTRALQAGKVVLATCTTDRSTNQLSGEVSLTPDLMGRNAAGIAGFFDYVGYATASTSLGKVVRAISFETRSVTLGDSQYNVVTRQRSVREIKTPFKLQPDQNNWTSLVAFLNAHMSVNPGETATEETPKSKWGHR